MKIYPGCIWHSPYNGSEACKCGGGGRDLVDDLVLAQVVDTEGLPVALCLADQQQAPVAARVMHKAHQPKRLTDWVGSLYPCHNDL